jgi:hypothetical protein
MRLPDSASVLISPDFPVAKAGLAFILNRDSFHGFARPYFNPCSCQNVWPLNPSVCPFLHHCEYFATSKRDHTFVLALFSFAQLCRFITSLPNVRLPNPSIPVLFNRLTADSLSPDNADFEMLSKSLGRVQYYTQAIIGNDHPEIDFVCAFRCVPDEAIVACAVLCDSSAASLPKICLTVRQSLILVVQFIGSGSLRFRWSRI